MMSNAPMESVPIRSVPAGALLTCAVNRPSDTAPLEQTEIDELLYEMTDPMNRYYRYPVAKAMLPLFMRLPATPNQITVFHTCLGILAGVLIARGTSQDLLLAFLFAEARMIFDCLDGVVARAKKLTSPYGRTIDEMGDAVGYISMQLGTLFHIHHRWPEENLVLLLFAGLLVPGWMAMTYDYYRRTFASALKGTGDGPADELVRRSVKAHGEGAGVVVRFALAFEWLQTVLLTPLAIPKIRARIRSEIRAASPEGGFADRQLQVASEGIRRRARTPGFKRLLRFASIVTGDNAITFFNFGLLTGALVMVEHLMIAVGFGLFVVTATVCACWIKKGTPKGLEET